jgi:hypothetical protein
MHTLDNKIGRNQWTTQRPDDRGVIADPDLSARSVTEMTSEIRKHVIFVLILSGYTHAIKANGRDKTA